MRTDPATVVGIGYVHPFQMHLAPGTGDFVAIGTAKGVGVSACASDYDALWTVYMDWVLGGVYQCFDVQTDVYGVGGKPSFIIQRTTCTSTGAIRWVLTWAGSQRACLVHGATSAVRSAAGLETTGPGTVDRNIDVKYTFLRTSAVGNANWVDFGNCELAPSFADPNYTIDSVSNTSCNLFLAPLN